MKSARLGSIGRPGAGGAWSRRWSGRCGARGPHDGRGIRHGRTDPAGDGARTGSTPTGGRPVRRGHPPGLAGRPAPVRAERDERPDGSAMPLFEAVHRDYRSASSRLRLPRSRMPSRRPRRSRRCSPPSALRAWSRTNFAAGPGAAGREPFTTEVVLTDGGVYDNLGLETVWKHYRTILVCDGGGKIARGRARRDRARHSIRVDSLIDNQVRSLGSASSSARTRPSCGRAPTGDPDRLASTSAPSRCRAGRPHDRAREHPRAWTMFGASGAADQLGLCGLRRGAPPLLPPVVASTDAVSAARRGGIASAAPDPRGTGQSVALTRAAA